MASTHDGDLTVAGNLTVTGSVAGNLDRGYIKQQTLEFPLLLTDFRIWDAIQTNLTTAGSDDLGITTATFGTAVPYLTSGDLNAAGAITRRARLLGAFPFNIVEGQDFYLTVEAGMLTTAASVSATVDLELYSQGAATLVNAAGDRITTSAQSINSTTLAVYRFFCNGSSVAVERGENFDLRLTIAANSATASSHFAIVSRVYFELPNR